MIWSKIMRWFFPERAEAQQRLEAVLSEHTLAGEALAEAKDEAAAHSGQNVVEADEIAAAAQLRIHQQQVRRARRERAARERGVILAIDDALLARSFGGPGDED